MCRTRCVLALMALYVGVAQSWDIAVSTEEVIEFHTIATKTIKTARFKSRNLTALVYDEVHNMMLFVDKQTDNDTICGYDLSSMDVTCFIERNGSNIHGLAFDPVTELLFFTDTNEKSINWISLKTFAPGSRNVVYGNLLLKMTDRTPTDIAVESCNGYIYWTNTDMTQHKGMERARLNGSESDVLYTRSLEVFTFAIDQQTQKMYYFDGVEDGSKYFNSADFDGNNEKMYFLVNISEPKVLTVSKDYLYWMTSSGSHKTVWRMPKNKIEIGETKEISKFYNDGRNGIAANYKIKEQIQGIPGCEALTCLVPNNSDGRFCVHGMKISGKSFCKCAPGYIGERCDVSVCENYCLQGNCSLKEKGLPKCSCNAGYYGKRCEVKAVNNNTSTFTNTPTYYSAERNLTVADLLSIWRKPTAKITVTVEV